MSDNQESVFSLKPEKEVKISGEGLAVEKATLKSLTALINTPEFSQTDGDGVFRAPEDNIPTAADQKMARPAKGPRVPLPPLKKSKAGAIAGALAVAKAPALVTRQPALEVKRLPDRIFTTGRLKAGKDHALAHFGYTTIGFADPLYALQEFFFGTPDKTVPGARKFLQTAGQWGRGEITAEYPLSPARAMFTHLVRNLGKREGFLSEMAVDWSAFGAARSIWLDALVRRADKLKIGDRVGVSNVRFQNEYDGLTAAGWTHYHVMCSQQTLAKRLEKSGLNLNSPEVKDMSEALATGMDADVYKRLKFQPNGGKLRVIWNDDEVAPPSLRLYTLAELQ